MNPYAAPKANLEEPLPAGSLWRDGNLVRMDRTGTLPDRCVICNQQASRRLVHTVYWSPALWRSLGPAAPFVMVFVGVAIGQPIVAALFWPVLVVLLVAHLFIRKKFKIDMAICERHRRLRNVLSGLSIAALAAAAVIYLNLSPSDGSITLLVSVIVVIIALAVGQSVLGVQAVSLKKLDERHAWIGGTGKPFREALPELPG